VRPVPPEAGGGAGLAPERLPFESGVFGVPVGRLLPPPAPGWDALGAAVEAWAEAGYWLVSCRLPEEDAAAIRALEAAGFRRVETLVTMRRSLEGGDAEPPPGVRRAMPGDRDAVVEIARTAFGFDRFHADPRVPRALADRLKAAWAANGLAGRAELALVAEEAGEVAGFNLLLKDGEEAVIDLIAVAPGFRGRGVGRRLVLAGLAGYAGRARAVRAGTQADNRPSLKLYGSLGFAPAARRATLHWINPRARPAPPAEGGPGPTGIVVFARMESKRLPGKSLAPIRGRPLLGHVLDRCRRARACRLVVVATSERPADDAIERFARAEGVAVFRGADDDVAARALACARAYRLDRVVRISADSPFVDPALIDEAIRRHEAGGFDVVTDVFPRTYPPGVSVEAIATDALARVLELTRDPADREHVTRYVYAHPDAFRIANFGIDPSRFRGLMLTVDTPEDLARTEWMMREAGRPAAELDLDAVIDLARRWRERAGA
jgi:spore coat polysaccharide biosynthesis protein SpsF